MRRLIVLAAALAAIMAIASTASAQRVNSTLTIQPKHPDGPNGRLTGVLISSKHSCVGGAKVRLFYNGGGGFGQVRHDDTNSLGKWTVHAPGGKIPKGKYFARVRSEGDCPGAKSRIVTVV